MATKQKEKSDATRQKILECSEELFYQKGFDKTTVREIVKLAGVAQGTFYLYFEAKEEVLLRIIEKSIDHFNAYLSMLDIENLELEDMDKIIDGLVFYMIENPQIIKLLHNANIVDIANLDNYDTKYEWQAIALITKWLERAMEKGLIRRVSPQLYARIILLISHELLENSFLYDYPDKITIIKEEIKTIIRKILI